MFLLVVGGWGERYGWNKVCTSTAATMLLMMKTVYMYAYHCWWVRPNCFWATTFSSGWQGHIWRVQVQGYSALGNDSCLPCSKYPVALFGLHISFVYAILSPNCMVLSPMEFAQMLSCSLDTYPAVQMWLLRFCIGILFNNVYFTKVCTRTCVTLSCWMLCIFQDNAVVHWAKTFASWYMVHSVG